VKMSLLKVPEDLIAKYSCESMEVTEALARNLCMVIPADICGALTGLASNGGSESRSKPVGTVFICVYYRKKMHRHKKLFRGRPAEIKLKACLELYRLIEKIL
jgi:nicotinamide-nucleotide amidase